MSAGPINLVYPRAQAALDDDTLLALYATSGTAPAAESTADSAASTTPELSARSRWVRANMISSVDGSATLDGLSGGLGTAADKRVFDVLRQLSDAVLVGAGTLRAEGYGALRLGADATAWRRANGRAEHPTLAIVSASLELDSSSAVFADAPTRPIVLTITQADQAARERLSEVADVVSCGRHAFDARLALDALDARGLAGVLCEGGPRLLASMIAADTVDELCISLSPTLEGGFGPRITASDAATEPHRLRLAHVLECEGLLMTRYVRDNSASVGA